MLIAPLTLFVAFVVGQNSPQASDVAVPQKPSANGAVISIDDVLRMVKAGLAPEIVAAKVRASKCECDTSAASLERLKSAAVPDSVIVAMIESSSATPARTPAKNLRDVKTVYLVNRSTDQKVFDNLGKKLQEWGRWKVVERYEDADVLLVLAEKGSYLGSLNTASAVGSGNYASGTGTSLALMSDQRFLIAVEPQAEGQLVVISCERRMSSGYTAGVLVNRMRKYIEKLEKQSTKQ